MTTDTATYTITFQDSVSETMPQRIEDCADGDVVTVTSTSIDDNVLTATVRGDGNAIPVFEQEVQDELTRYPNADLECTVDH